MKIDFTGRGVEVTDLIRNHTQGKLERLKNHWGEMRDISVVLSVEKYRQRSEIKFLSQKKTFHGAEETNDMFQSIDRVVEKLEAQLKKHKEKLNTKKRHHADSVRVNVISRPDFTGQSTGGEREIRIIRSDRSVVKPMVLEEAVDELDKLNQEFIIFRNSDTDKLNVVYHRKDGHIGLIEPQS